MDKSIRKKLHTDKGFTLAETLLAVLILLMVSLIVATGIPVAKTAYEKVVLTSNAKILLSTTMSTLRNELGSAKDVEKPDADVKSGEKENSVITYYNTTRNAASKIYVTSASEEKPEIMFQRYFSTDGMSKPYEPASLIPDAAATADLYVTYESVSFDNITGIIQFNNIEVRRKNETSVLAQRPVFTIRNILN